MVRFESSTTLGGSGDEATGSETSNRTPAPTGGDGDKDSGAAAVDALRAAVLSMLAMGFVGLVLW